MEKIIDRLKFWRKKIAQTTSSTTTTSTSTPATTNQPAPFTITNIPSFKANLFAIRPDLIEDLNKIANIINRYMLLLSNNQINFNLTWTNPSVGTSAFSNSLKNLYGLAIWVTKLVTVNGPPYSLQSLLKVCSDLKSVLNQYDFPEAQASNVKSELINATQVMINKIGEVPNANQP